MSKNGVIGSREGLKQRYDCGSLRKIEPFTRAVTGLVAWGTRPSRWRWQCADSREWGLHSHLPPPVSGIR